MTRAVKHAIFSEEVENLGWIGKYVVPGRSVTTVTDRAGRAELFRSQAEAMAVAGLCLCAALNGARAPQSFVPRRRERSAEAGLSAEARSVFSNFS